MSNPRTLWEVFADEPVLPYSGTSGWSGSDTSRDRAERSDKDGTTSQRQREVTRYLGAAGSDGMTWRDLSEQTGWHHGTASGALSVLHKEGTIVRLTERRDRCQVYVLPEWVQGRETAQHRPNASRTILLDLLDELDHLLATGRFVEARSLVARTKATI